MIGNSNTTSFLNLITTLAAGPNASVAPKLLANLNSFYQWLMKFQLNPMKMKFSNDSWSSYIKGNMLANLFYYGNKWNTASELSIIQNFLSTVGTTPWWALFSQFIGPFNSAAGVSTFRNPIGITVNLTFMISSTTNTAYWKGTTLNNTIGDPYSIINTYFNGFASYKICGGNSTSMALVAQNANNLYFILTSDDVSVVDNSLGAIGSQFTGKRILISY